MTIKELDEKIKATANFYGHRNYGRLPDAILVTAEQFNLWWTESNEIHHQALGQRPIAAHGFPLIVILPQTITPGLHDGPRVVTPLAVGVGQSSEGIFGLSS